MGDADLTPAVNTSLAHQQRIRRAKAVAARIEQKLLEGGYDAIQNLSPRTSPLALYEALLSCSWKLRHEDPKLMKKYTWLAVFQAQRADARIHGQPFISDLICRALAEHGNACRVGDEFTEAAWAEGRAREVFALGTGDEDLEIRLTELEAALAADRRLFPAACIKLERVFEFHRARGNSNAAGRALVAWGLYAGYSDDTAAAVDLLNQSLLFLDKKSDPGLIYAVRHNQLYFLVEERRYKEARRFRLEHSKELFTSISRMNELRLRAIGGRIDTGLGKLSRAEDTFRKLAQEFREIGKQFDHALSLLELGTALLLQKKTAEGEAVVLEATKIFSLLEIQQEANLAIILLRDFCLLKKVTPGLVDEVASFLRRCEHDPDRPFTPRSL